MSKRKGKGERKERGWGKEEGKEEEKRKEKGKRYSHQLIGNIRMILTGQTRTNSTLHQTRKRGKYINRRINTTTMQTSININLTLSDITSQIRNWMGNI